MKNQKAVNSALFIFINFASHVRLIILSTEKKITHAFGSYLKHFNGTYSFKKLNMNPLKNFFSKSRIFCFFFIFSRLQPLDFSKCEKIKYAHLIWIPFSHKGIHLKKTLIITFQKMFFGESFQRAAIIKNIFPIYKSKDKHTQLNIYISTQS